MPTKQLLALAVILVSALAGCVSDDVETPGNEPPTPGQTPTTPGAPGLPFKPAEANNLERQLQAIEIVPEGSTDFQRPNMTRKDWLFLSTTMSPEGGFTVFKWDYPADAVVHDGNTDREVVSLDFAIGLDPMGTPAGLLEGTDWLVVAFYDRHDPEDGWQTALAGYRRGITSEVTTWDPSGSPSTSVRPASSEPFAIPVPAGTDDVGDSIYIAVAARGAAGSAFGVGVRALPQEYAGATESPTEGWTDFLGLVQAKDRAPLVPTRAAQGSGLYLAFRSEIVSSSAGAIVHSVTDMDPPQEIVPPEASDVISGRVTTMGSEVSWGGFTLVEIRYTNIPDVSRWEVTGTINGEDAGVSGWVDNTAKSCRATTEGGTGSALENTITNPVTLAVELVYYQHFSIGFEIAPISGLPMRTDWSC